MVQYRIKQVINVGIHLSTTAYKQGKTDESNTMDVVWNYPNNIFILPIYWLSSLYPASVFSNKL